jgi:thiamine biosynthesis lipoprotein ApbE
MLTALLVPALLCGFGLRSARAAEEFVYYHENVMGTSLELRVRADSEEAARWAEDRVLGEIDRLSRIFSGYDPKSEFSRWQSTSNVPTKLSAELFELLQASDDWRAKSGGAFDPRVESLTRLWSSFARKDRMPSTEELASAKALMSSPAWRLEAAAGTAEHLTSCPLTLNAIAKGYIVEQACAAAFDKSRGVLGLLLNGGGDLRVCGDISRTIGIANPWNDSETTEPLASIEVRNRAVATSGSSQRGFRINGKWYSHIFDPRTGRPVDRVASATVIAERSAVADAMATIFNVLEPEESLRMASALPGVDCLILSTDGKVWQSDGWPRFETRRSPLLAFAAGQVPPASGPKKDDCEKPDKVEPDGFWGNEYELVVNFEINRPDATERRYRRPYVVVWVEDKEGHQVRTLALWLSTGGAAPYPWLPDLKRWYRTEQARPRGDKTDLAGTISRPTRPPGQYKVIWDGKDNNGKPIGRGDYTVHIEAAREHGTYQSIRKQVNLTDKTFAEELTGNVEIKSASLEYRRKDPAK